MTIIDQKQTEEALRESEEKYRTLFNSGSDAVFVHELRTEGAPAQFSEVNDIACQMLGYTREELLRLSPADITAPESLDQIPELRERLFTEERSLLELMLVTKDKKKIPVEINDHLFDFKGKPTVLSIVRNITDRKHAEEALRASEEQFRILSEASLMGVFIFQDMKFRYVNPAVAETFGYHIDELIGKLGPLELTVPEDHAASEKYIKTCFSGQERQTPFTFHGLRRNGDIIDCEVLARRITYRGQPALIGTILDITDRKRAENLLRIQRDLALVLSAESEMKKAADRLLEHLLQIEEFDCGGVYLVDEGTGALDLIAHKGLLRQFVEQTTHYEADAPQTRFVMTGTPSYRSYTEILPETKNQVRLQEGLRAFAVIPVIFEGQVIAALNLASHTYNEIPMPIRNTLEAMATTHIGEALARVKVEAALQTLNAELEQRVTQRTAALEAANKELKNFAYVVSHDLKAPLRGISRLAQWLVADYTDAFDEQGKDMINLLIGRVKRMDNLIEGILQYSRVGRLIDKDEQIDLNTLVKDVIDMLAPPDQIHIAFENELPVIMGDKIRIVEVFQNLLTNAIEFMDKPDGRIAIGCEDDGSYWKFSIADTGPGIDPKYHKKIFQIFQTLAPRDEHESPGIGLALVKKIVELYGGNIGVESVPGKGSTFWFTLPKN